jgi:hypothetical protein
MLGALISLGSVIAFACLSRALSAVLPGMPPALDAGFAAVCSALLITLAWLFLKEDEDLFSRDTLVVELALLGVMLAVTLKFFPSALEKHAVMLMLLWQALSTLTVTIWHFKQLKDDAEYVGLKLIKNITWVSVESLLVAAALCTLTLAPQAAFEAILFAVFVAIGRFAGGTNGAVIGGFAFLASFLIAFALDLDDFLELAPLRQELALREMRKVSLLERLGLQFGSKLSSGILSASGFLEAPITLMTYLALWVSGRLPARSQPFFCYCSQALLLKPFSGEIEFTHRLLRDHFALRDLIPQLGTADAQRRVEIISAIGFQGVAAIETLAEYATNGSTSERAAAAEALGRIAAPETAPLLQRAITDPSSAVRATAVGSLSHVERTERDQLILTACVDKDSTVQVALILVGAAERECFTLECSYVLLAKIKTILMQPAF